MANQTPSIRPADEGTLAGVIKTAVNKAMQAFDGMLPVEVVAYDRATNRATVRHLVQMVGTVHGLQKGAPNTARMHSFQDGVFMPDAMSNGDAPAGQSGRVVIGANDGSAFFSFDGSGLYFSCGGVEVAITGAGISITGGTVTHNGVNIGDDHAHTGVTPGGGTSGPPV